ncbi:MAG: hypothetical protein IPI43_34440 [Sandaracinaceae bacterium]|nr:hypothetical protein [Sandaracinaceae bacterium]
MPTLAFTDPRKDLAAWAARLSISQEADEMLARKPACIDLPPHGTFIWTRIFSYDLGKKHGEGLRVATSTATATLPARHGDCGAHGRRVADHHQPVLARQVRRSLFFRTPEALPRTSSRNA